MHYCVYMHWGIPLSTTRQENVHYVYHNVAVMITILMGVQHQQLPVNAHSTRKGAKEVCEPTDGFILARVDRV